LSGISGDLRVAFFNGGTMKEDRERLTFPMELRVQKNGEKRRIVGHAAVFGQWSEDLGGFREKVAAGAFKKTLKEADVRALWNHDPNFVLGRNKAGTLELSEDDTGLAVDIDPPDVQWARDLMVSMERGDVTQMSFGFRTVKDAWNEEDKQQIERELLEVELFDVSPVTYPAYPQTSVSARDHVRSLQGEPVDADHSPEADEPDNAVHSSPLKRLLREHQLREIEIETEELQS